MIERQTSTKTFYSEAELLEECANLLEKLSKVVFDCPDCSKKVKQKRPVSYPDVKPTDSSKRHISGAQTKTTASNNTTRSESRPGDNNA